MTRAIRRLFAWLRDAAIWALGDYQDWACPSNANFLGLAIPLLGGLLSGIFKKKAQSKAQQEQVSNQQAAENYQRQQELGSINEYNTARTSDVQRRRDLLKAMIMSKGWNNSPIWQSLGGFDQYFSRPVSGLKSTASYDIPRPQQRTGAGGGWNMFGDLIGTGVKAYSDYQSQKAAEEAGQERQAGGFFGQAGGDPAEATRTYNDWQKFRSNPSGSFTGPAGA